MATGPRFYFSLLLLLLGLCLHSLHAAPLDGQKCNNETSGGVQISDNGLQSQTQTGAGCQSQVSEDGSQSQSQIQNGNGTQSQTQCNGTDCAPLSTYPPLFTLKPLEPLTWKPLEWNTFRPFEPMDMLKSDKEEA